MPERYPEPSPQPSSRDAPRRERSAGCGPTPVSAPEGPSKEHAEAGQETRDRPSTRRGPLPLWLRIVVLLVGWIVLLVGVAGLVLPGIQGIATILIGAAILSVASEIAYEWMRAALRRWPAVWNRVERFRERIHDKLHRMLRRS